jgi:hypothetical protein
MTLPKNFIKKFLITDEKYTQDLDFSTWNVPKKPSLPIGIIFLPGDIRFALVILVMAIIEKQIVNFYEK